MFCMVILLWLWLNDGALVRERAGLRRAARAGWCWPPFRRPAAALAPASPASARNREGPPVGRPAALGGVGDQQPVLGAGGGDVEQPALLLEPPRIGRGQRAPGRQQLLLAGEQHHQLGLGPFGAVDRAHRDPVIGGGVDLLRVQTGGVVEKAGERGVLVLLLVGLGGAAQRAQVLEHPLGIGASLVVGRVVAQMLVVADQAAGQQ